MEFTTREEVIQEIVNQFSLSEELFSNAQFWTLRRLTQHLKRLKLAHGHKL
jgi:hypothetical protein